MTFQLRSAVAEDFPAITSIYTDAVLNGTASYEMAPPDRFEMEQRWQTIVQSGYHYLVAISSDQSLLGYAYTSAFRTRAAYRWLVEDSVYLDPAARGQGIGTALLDALIKRSEASGFRQMVAVVGGASKASIALHARCGFSIAGTLSATGFKHGQWLDTVFMQRPLGAGNTTDPELII